LLGPHLLRPLAGAEDLARELVRSLDPIQRTVATLSPVPPVDLVTANRARVSDGDLPLPLADIWRDRFEGELDERLRTIQQHAERSVGLTTEHLEAVRLTSTPQGVSGRLLSAGQREMLRSLLDVYVRRIPDDLADEETAKYAGPLVEDLSFSWAGGTSPVNRTTTEWRAQGWSPSTTTPNEEPTTFTACGATLRATSVTTCSRVTTSKHPMIAEGIVTRADRSIG